MKRTQFGRYELLRKLAAGGMAEIFLARHWTEGGFFHDVVLKVLFQHLAEHRRALEMFQYEARLLAHLCHPNIPQVYELGFQERWYMAMEHVDGCTLGDVCRAGTRAGQPMPMAVASGVTMQVCEALHHAHERRDKAGRALRIVHRDVTPQNIMLTRDGVTKLMDFGVAQTAARRDTEVGTVKGTFSYMAPEQVRARPLDKRADVFAVGVILYELTTGTRLFPGNDVQVMTAVVETDAPRPSTRVPDFPRDLEEIIMAALRRDRRERLPSTAHLASALEDLAVRRGLSTGPRAISRYVSSIFPYEKAHEVEVALVQVPSRLELVPDGDSSDEWVAAMDELSAHVGARRSRHEPSEPEINLDDPSLAADLRLLDPVEDPEIDEVPPPLHLPQPFASNRAAGPPALDVLLFDDTTETGIPLESSEDSGLLEGFDDAADEAQPVVLLENPKKEGSEERDFLRDLGRRLEAEDTSD